MQPLPYVYCTHSKQYSCKCSKHTKNKSSEENNNQQLLQILETVCKAVAFRIFIYGVLLFIFSTKKKNWMKYSLCYCFAYCWRKCILCFISIECFLIVFCCFRAFLSFFILFFSHSIVIILCRFSLLFYCCIFFLSQIRWFHGKFSLFLCVHSDIIK